MFSPRGSAILKYRSLARSARSLASRSDHARNCKFVALPGARARLFALSCGRETSAAAPSKNKLGMSLLASVLLVLPHAVLLAAGPPPSPLDFQPCAGTGQQGFDVISGGGASASASGSDYVPDRCASRP